jgi:lipopolysaccharide export system protein LptA
VRKYLFLSLFVLISFTAWAQKRPQRTIVNLVQSERSVGVKLNGEDILKVYKGIFKQEGSTLRSDSAYFYPQRNSFDAFGNVNIKQGDTLNVYGDKLYYNGNTHVALVTNNVRMVDRDATLTTNYLTYNTATRIGTYTGGGKLVNKDNTLVSKNGYYFATSRDAYFRHDVVLTTVDATIKTDTLRYNSGSRIAYFYGPTRILGKDKDTLYTERGNYNTVVEQAFFSKNNLYTQTTKSLKGDSLFYDRLKGYGRAVGNVTFDDNEQKVIIKGQLGTFYRATERAVITQQPYVIMITEQRDSTKTDSVKAKRPVVKNARGKTQSVAKTTAPLNSKPLAKVPGNITATDTTRSKNDTLALKPPPRIKRDTIYWGADTIETQIITYKALREMQERMRLAGVKDTSAKRGKAETPARVPLKLSTPKNLIAMPPADIKMDMSFLRPDIFGKPRERDTTQKAKPAVAAVKKPVAKPPLPAKLDSVYMRRQFNLSDTARIRILSAHHNAKIFKSDLQAKADSMFYSYADSTMRCFVDPIIWTQGSQISGDTVYLQLKNKKVDNMDVFLSAFTVNIEGADSTHFNQVAGKRMKGFFANNKFQRLFVDGNAETIYYNRDSTKTVNELMRTISSRIRVNFRENKVSNITWLTKVEEEAIPIKDAKDDDKILKGFLWKPKERPKNKEAIIYAAMRKKAAAKKVAAAKVPPGIGKKVTDAAAKKVPAGVDKALKPALALPDSATVKAVKDTLLKLLPGKKELVDSVKAKLLKP